jgi:regulatory protein
MVITKIERQKRHPHRVNVYADGEFAIGLHEEIFLKFRLQKGDRLDYDILKEIEAAEEFNLAKEKAFRLLSYRLRSEKELRGRLEESEFHPAVIDKTIEHLRAARILDDTMFAKAFVNQLLMRKPAGKSLLQRELRSRGITKEIIQEVLRERLTDDEEQHLANAAVQKMLRRLPPAKGQINERKQRQRIANFLARRGFSWPTISAALRNVSNRYAHTEEEE